MSVVDFSVILMMKEKLNRKSEINEMYNNKNVAYTKYLSEKS